jgi:hypothetical protein
MRTIWLVWGCAFIALVYFVAGCIYSVSVGKKYGWQSEQVRMWLKNSNVFSPAGLNRFQMLLWRIDLILRWICIGLAFILLSIELALFILRKG